MKRFAHVTGIIVSLLFLFTQAKAQNFCQVELTNFPDTILCGDTVDIEAAAYGGQVQFSENFDLGALSPGWQSTAGISFNNPCGPGPGGSTNAHMWMGNGIAANRAVATVGFDLSCGSGVVCFDLRMALQVNSSPCEGPDEPDEGVFLQFSTNNGASWNTIYYFNPDTVCCGCPPGGCGGNPPSPFVNWGNYCFPLPPAAQTTNTQLRWFQVNTSGSAFDHWGLDNVTISTNCGSPFQFDWSELNTNVTPPTTSYLYTDPVSDTSVLDTFLYQSTSFSVMYYNGADTCYDTTSVTVLPRPIGLTVSDTQICDFESVNLQASGGNTYTYDILPGGDPIQVGTNFTCANCDNPVATPSSTTSYVVSSEFTGVCHGRDTVEVTVLPPPDPTITSQLSFCRTEGPYQFTAADPGGTWLGVGVDPVTGIFDPLAIGAPGNSQVVYQFTQPCFIADTISVLNYQPYDFNLIDTPKTVCVSDTLVLTNYQTLTGPTYGPGPVKYSWAGPGITDPDQGFFDPDIVGPGNTFVTVTASDLNDGCPSSQTMRILVYAIDTPKTINPLLYCNTSNNAFVSVDKGFGTSSNWTITPIAPTTGNLAISNSGTFSPTMTGAGEWLLDYTHTNLNGCTGVLLDTIRVLQAPPTPQVLNANYCAGDPIILETDNTVDADSLIWYSSPTADPSSELGSGVPYFYGLAQDPNATGPITVYARELNSICPSAVSAYVLPVQPSPSADFVRFYTDSNGIQQSNVTRGSFIEGPSPLGIEFQALNLNPGDSVYWDLWVDCTNDPNNAAFGCPVTDDNDRPRVAFTYEKEGLYNVMLIHTNPFGCADTVYADHRVLFEAVIPNVFTPNGDGNNDIFTIPGAQGLRNFKCQVFNRWGRMVYEWTDPNEGWDGSDATDGVYFYIVTGKRAGGEEYTEKGQVTLLGNGS